MENPHAEGYDCHYCGAKGCMCPGPIGTHLPDCEPCGPCGETGQLSRKQLDDMAADYKRDEDFKVAWKSGRE